MGRIALQKPVWGCAVMLVSIVQQIKTNVDKFMALFQRALSTQAGCECLAHSIQAT